MNNNEKQKIPGIDNKEIIAFAAIIGAIILLLMFEIFFFEGRTEVADQSVIHKERLEKMEAVTVETEQRTVYHVLNDIVDMMNNKDYQGLYDMLKEDYKNYYFAKYEDFEDFIKTYAGQTYYPKYSSYYRDGDLYYINVDFLRAKYTREDLLKQKITKIDTIVLEEVGDNEFKFAMNGFVESIFHNSSKTVKDVTFSLQNSVRNTETMEITVLISNKSDKMVTVSTYNLIPDIMGAGGNIAKISATSSVFLDPGEIGALTIEYYLQYDSGKEFKGVTISEATFSDGTVLEDVYLAK